MGVSWCSLWGWLCETALFISGSFGLRDGWGSLHNDRWVINLNERQLWHAGMPTVLVFWVSQLCLVNPTGHHNGPVTPAFFKQQNVRPTSLHWNGTAAISRFACWGEVNLCTAFTLNLTGNLTLAPKFARLTNCKLSRHHQPLRGGRTGVSCEAGVDSTNLSF